MYNNCEEEYEIVKFLSDNHNPVETNQFFQSLKIKEIKNDDDDNIEEVVLKQQVPVGIYK